MLWADLWFPLIFVFTKRMCEAPHDKKRSYIFVTNHISLLDAAVIVKGLSPAHKAARKSGDE